MIKKLLSEVKGTFDYYDSLDSAEFLNDLGELRDGYIDRFITEETIKKARPIVQYHSTSYGELDVNTECSELGNMIIYLVYQGDYYWATGSAEDIERIIRAIMIVLIVQDNLEPMVLDNIPDAITIIKTLKEYESDGLMDIYYSFIFEPPIRAGISYIWRVVILAISLKDKKVVRDILESCDDAFEDVVNGSHLFDYTPLLNAINEIMDVVTKYS